MKVIINGACGRMGMKLTDLVNQGVYGAELVAGVDISGGADYTSLDDVPARADVIIDFTNHSACKTLVEYAARTLTPVVIATTGHTEDEMAAIDEAAQKTAVFMSSNMSVGIALLADLAKQAAKAMGDADIEIVETHHNRKADAPSGTAYMLAEAIREVRPELYVKTGRSGYGKRDKNELGIQSVRVGNVIGEHEVIVGTDAQTIRLRHEAHDRILFAEGALRAAKFICGKPAGKYNMKDLFK